MAVDRKPTGPDCWAAFQEGNGATGVTLPPDVQQEYGRKPLPWPTCEGRVSHNEKLAELGLDNERDT